MRLQQSRLLAQLSIAFAQSISTLDWSLNPKDGLQRLSEYPFTIKDTVYLFHAALAIFWIVLMQQPPFPYKLLIPICYIIALLVPLTSQFFIPATPIFNYLLSFYSSRFIPQSWRPTISVATLPTLESVLYGANISDILTRYTNPILDILAWIPYGVLHFTAPFLVAASVWLFAPKPALKFWATAFGYLNLIGVIFQILFPCAAPCWYLLIYAR
jgi:inositol phosphorylceramide synthase catalytic subunit